MTLAPFISVRLTPSLRSSTSTSLNKAFTNCLLLLVLIVSSLSDPSSSGPERGRLVCWISHILILDQFSDNVIFWRSVKAYHTKKESNWSKRYFFPSELAQVAYASVRSHSEPERGKNGLDR